MRVPPNFFLLSLAVADMITLLGGKKLNIFDSVQPNIIVHFKTGKLSHDFGNTVKLRAVDRSTIKFWNFLAKGHST